MAVLTMTRDDIIRMARKANILEPLGYDNPHMNNWRDDVVRNLERFAALVAAAEREACLKVCEAEGARIDASWTSCAAAIRARGQV